MKFALIVREDITREMTVEQLNKVIALHREWARKLDESGYLIDGFGLMPEGHVLKWSDQGVLQLDIPNPKMAFGGVYYIQADDYEHALDIAKQCPTLPHGDLIEVRPCI